MKTLDIGGIITLMATLAFFIVGLNIGGQSKPWNSPLVVGMLCAAGVTFILFVIAENKAKEPIAPPRLFTQWRWRNVPLVIGRILSAIMSILVLNFHPSSQNSLILSPFRIGGSTVS